MNKFLNLFTAIQFYPYLLNHTREQGPGVHGEGCSACHVSYAEDGRYHGGDVTLKEASPPRGASPAGVKVSLHTASVFLKRSSSYE